MLIRAEREVKNDISQSRMWWITKPARVCSCLTSGWCGRNRTDVSWIGIKTLQGFRQRGHVRSEVKLSPVMQKKKLLKAADCGDTFILNWFHIIFNSPFKKKKRSIASWVWRDAWSNFPEGKQDRAVKPCNVERTGSRYSSLSTQSRPVWRQHRYSSVTANGRRSSKVMHAWTTHASNISNNSKLIFRLLVG